MLSDFFHLKKHPTVRMISVDLGVCSVDIPVADFKSAKEGPTILITGGVDGDEYAGIEAAYALIEEFENGRTFAGRIIIIPILNIPGFFAECSQNPIDGEYPKNTFPGAVDGSATERLIDWLVKTYICHAEVWFDMHAGAITEGVNPFLWTYVTDNAIRDRIPEKLCELNCADIILTEPARWGSSAAALAKMGCTYIRAESGGRGERRAIDVARHGQWAHTIMSLMKMEEVISVRVARTKIIAELTFSVAPFEGLWRPAEIEGHEIKKGMLLGTCLRLDGSGEREVRAAASGTRLWWKETMRMQRGEVLCAFGR